MLKNVTCLVKRTMPPLMMLFLLTSCATIELVDSLSKQINNIETKVVSTNDQIGRNKADIEEIRKRLCSLEERVNKLENKSSETDQDVKLLKIQIQELKKMIKETLANW